MRYPYGLKGIIASERAVAPPASLALTLPLAKAVAERRRRLPEIAKASASRVQYEGSIRRATELATMRAERDRLKGLLSRPGVSHPDVLRQRFSELESSLR